MPFTLAGLQRGLVAGWPFLVSTGLSGVVMGVAYRGIGLDLLTATFFSAAVYSGTAQAVTLGMWASAPSIAALAVACFATNARYLIMSAQLRQLFADTPRRVMLPVLWILADASWFMTVAESQRGRRDAGYLLGCSVPMATGWIAGTALGHALPLQPHGPLAAAATFLPLAFISSLLPTQGQGFKSLLPWMAAAGTALLVAGTLGANWAMILGGAAGTLVCLARGDDV